MRPRGESLEDTVHDKAVSPPREKNLAGARIFGVRDGRSKAKARKWLREHGHQSGDVDVRVKTYRFRQRNPKDFEPASFRTIVLANGVEVVLGHLKR